MKLLLLFCCLSAGCVFWTEASPFFFNIPRTVISQTTQIRRQPVVAAGTSFGLGGLISKWFPSISINKQFGTRRPKPTQRPVIEVTTIFEPSEVDTEGETTSIKPPAESIDNINESSSASYESSSVGEIDEISSTASTSEESIVEKNSTTTTTTTPLPFEELEPFTESKTTTSTTELPFEETEPNYSTTTKVPEQFTEGKTSSTTITTQSTFEETEISNENNLSSTETYKPFTEIKTSTTTELPYTENESSTKTTTTTQSFINEIGFTTEEYIPSSSTQVSIPNTGYLPAGSDKEEISSIKPIAILPTTYRPVYVPITTTTSAPVYVPSTSTNVPVYVPSTSTNVPVYVPSTSTNVPIYVPTTTTNAPWKETPTDIINTGGIVNPNKPIESYVYVRPDISADDILFNEVSPRARPFESLSVIGTTSNGDRVERTYKPDENQNGEINERPRVTFYSNYFTY